MMSHSGQNKLEFSGADKHIKVMLTFLHFYTLWCLLCFVFVSLWCYLWFKILYEPVFIVREALWGAESKIHRESETPQGVRERSRERHKIAEMMTKSSVYKKQKLYSSDIHKQRKL